MVALLLDSIPETTHPKAQEADLDLVNLPTETGHKLAGLFKLLADETRLRIIYFLLQKDEINVRTFCGLLGQSQPAVSHHLALLRVAGLIESRRDGKHNFYRILPQRFQQFLDMVFEVTPDKETGIGSWTREQIVTAIQTGQRPDGRMLAPIMPWHAFAQLTKEDAGAIAAFLQSLKPVSHQVPGPFKPGEKVSTFMFRILPPGETAAAAPK